MTGQQKTLCETIGYTFKNEKLLETALTHSSFSNEGKESLRNNERMEFLGDAVLGLVTAEHLYSGTKKSEGEMTKERARLVCEAALSGYAKKLNLGDCLRLGKGEQQNGGHDRASILADAMEALIAAVYLDGGMKPASALIMTMVGALRKKQKTANIDYKTRLQEIAQHNPGEKLRYRTVDESGPAHQKVFTAEVLLNTNVLGSGTGTTVKEAQQQAAREALKLMGE